MPFIVISIDTQWQQEENLVMQKVELARLGELRTEPGQPIEPLNQDRGADDCLLEMLENESRDQINGVV
jgi:hypothetical protein